MIRALETPGTSQSVLEPPKTIQKHAVVTQVPLKTAQSGLQNAQSSRTLDSNVRNPIGDRQERNFNDILLRKYTHQTSKIIKIPLEKQYF